MASGPEPSSPSGPTIDGTAPAKTKEPRQETAGSIPTKDDADADDEALKHLTENVRNQDDLERDITLQASRALAEAENERDIKRIEKAETHKSRLEVQLRTRQQKLRSTTNPSARLRIQNEINNIKADIEICDKDIADFKARIEKRSNQDTEEVQVPSSRARLPGETQREYLIRTGKITPFAAFRGQLEEFDDELTDAGMDAEDEALAKELEEQHEVEGPRSHQILRAPGFGEDGGISVSTVEAEFSLRPRKKRKQTETNVESDEEFEPEQDSETEDVESDFSDDVDLTETTAKRKRGKATKKEEAKVDLSNVDDGNEAVYQARLKNWVGRRSLARRCQQERLGQPVDDGSDGVEEWFKPLPNHPDHHLGNGLKLPGDIYPSLFDYQKTGVQWLAELYAQKVGGIIGDEMGLGKTVQLISFIAALHYSKKLDKPVLVVAPATVLKQWVNEFHRWWPPLRVSILHSSGSGMLNVRHEGEMEDHFVPWAEEQKKKKKPSARSQAVKKIVDRVVKHGHVLVTTYAGLQTYGDVLIPVEWGYAVLDEGHKIRNPNTAITISCKELRTHNRIILSGTPMQNNLIELWSLFDFVYPMRLGTLVEFRTQFEIPIKQGGYANASNLQIMTAQMCAETLKDAISPYLLQRLKVDVAADLPQKSEKVLFCKLTTPQREAYVSFLKSEAMTAIMNRTKNALYGISVLRKICNHPDLLDPHLKAKPGYAWGDESKSGKMAVVKCLLLKWKREGHKTLLFCQGSQMLNILEAFVKGLADMRYLRMDGSTPIKDRQVLVDKFNNSRDLDVFLLTTKVGGLGVNLTGASRVIIYDPDWNPSTDVQARERAWRLGQTKDVTICRLMVAGAIEEKIYHRQIFKQFLSNKVLKDPTQQALFNLNDLQDLFSLNSYDDGVTETSELLKGPESNTRKDPKQIVLPGHGDSMPVPPHLTKKQNAEPHTGTNGDETDLQNIDGVAGLEDYEASSEPPPNEGDRILEGILAKNGVHSVLEHDDVINGNKVRADPKMLQQIAGRMAADAARSLDRAAERARTITIGTVTWTGEVGEAGRPTNPRRGVHGQPGSGIGSAHGSRSATPGGRPEQPVRRAKDFEKMIIMFMKKHNGKVPSKKLVDHFGRYCATKKAVGIFRLALDTVADLEENGSHGEGMWTLKRKYR